MLMGVLTPSFRHIPYYSRVQETALTGSGQAAGEPGGEIQGAQER